jgi:polysaccharide export outer membrane protein
MKLYNIKKIVFIGLVIALSSCNYNSNVMLKTGKNYPYDAPPSNVVSEYMISPSDIVEFRLYTNDGSALVDFTAIKNGTSSGNLTSSVSYLVENDGQVKLPIIGRIELKNKTIKEVEELLEKRYEKYYIKPFVQFKVTNKRITVFPGGSSKAQIIPLTNNNMNLLEAIGAVGGMPELAKAFKIKLIRGKLSDPKVYLFDFSTIEGIKQADFVLQANDIVYIEPRSDDYHKILKEITPIVSLIISAITLIVVIQTLRNSN